MEPIQRVAVIQTELAALRKEIDERVKAQSTFWRMIVAGLAGIIVLKDNLNVQQFLPITPVVILLAIAHWGNQQQQFVRLRRWLAAREQKVNALAGDDVLGWELSLSANPSRTRWRLPGVALIMFAAWLWTVRYLPVSSLAAVPGAAPLLYTLLALASAMAVYNYYVLERELARV